MNAIVAPDECELTQPVYTIPEISTHETELTAEKVPYEVLFQNTARPR